MAPAVRRRLCAPQAQRRGLVVCQSTHEIEFRLRTGLVLTVVAPSRAPHIVTSARFFSTEDASLPPLAQRDVREVLAQERGRVLQVGHWGVLRGAAAGTTNSSGKHQRLHAAPLLLVML